MSTFTKKTPAEFDALSEYQKEKYLDELSQHEKAEAKDVAEKAAKAVIEEMKDEHRKEVEKLIAAIKSENKEELEKLSKENKERLEEVEAAMKRAKIGEANIRMKGFSQHIIERLYWWPLLK